MVEVDITMVHGSGLAFAMNIKARLSLEERDLQSAQKAASTLSEAGFSITGISGRGISFEGEEEQFRSYFGEDFQRTGDQVTFKAEPKLTQLLPESKASLYFPTKPEFHS